MKPVSTLSDRTFDGVTISHNYYNSNVLCFRTFWKPQTESQPSISYTKEHCIHSYSNVHRIYGITSDSYSLKVDAIDADGSFTETLTTLPPYVPTDVTCVTGLSQDSQTIVVTWSPVYGSEGYVIQYKQVSMPYNLYTTIQPVTSPYTVTGLIPNTVYSVQVKATGGVFGSNILCTTLFPAPMSVSFNGIGATSASVTWTSVANAASYVMRYKPTSAPDSSYVQITISSYSPYTISGLIPTTAYSVQVKATGGVFGSAVAFTTLAKVSTCVIYSRFMASSITSALNSRISGWPDSSGNFRHMISGNKCLLALNTVAGSRAVVRSDVANQGFVDVAGARIMPTNGSSYTVMLLYCHLTASDAINMAHSTYFGAITGRPFLGRYRGDAGPQNVHASPLGYSGTIIRSTFTPIHGKWYALFLAVGALANAPATLYINDNGLARTVSTGTFVTPLPATDSATSFMASNGSSYGMIADCLECATWTGCMTSDDVSNEIGQLNAKYGLGL
jgi:Fibronectin type III domain